MPLQVSIKNSQICKLTMKTLKDFGYKHFIFRSCLNQAKLFMRVWSLNMAHGSHHIENIYYLFSLLQVHVHVLVCWVLLDTKSGQVLAMATQTRKPKMKLFRKNSISLESLHSQQSSMDFLSSAELPKVSDYTIMVEIFANFCRFRETKYPRNFWKGPIRENLLPRKDF